MSRLFAAQYYVWLGSPVRTWVAAPSALLRSAIILLASNGVAGTDASRVAGAGGVANAPGLALLPRAALALRLCFGPPRRLPFDTAFFTSLGGGAAGSGVSQGVGTGSGDATSCVDAAAGLCDFAGWRARAIRAARSRPGVFSGTESA